MPVFHIIFVASRSLVVQTQDAKLADAELTINKTMMERKE